MWQIRSTETYERRLKQFAKKHPRELAAMLDNLDTYMQSLEAGVRPQQVRHGFMHAETHGAIAIDQKGASGKPRQTRLYLYADDEAEMLYLITIGDKRTQQDDNAACREFILEVRNEKQKQQDLPERPEDDSRPAPG